MSSSARTWRSALALAVLVLLAFVLGWWLSERREAPQTEPAPPGAPAPAAVEPVAESVPADVDPPREAVAAPEPAAPAPSAPATHAKYALKVRVADPRGVPVCGASVELQLKNPDSITERASARAQPVATTGQDGVAAREFSLEDLTRGPMEPAPEGMRIDVPEIEPVPAGSTRVALWAKRAGYSSVAAEFLLDLAVQAPELALEMDRGLVLYGKVHYADGTPVERASIGLGVVSARTDERGELVGTELCEGVRVRSPGVPGWTPGQEVGVVVVSPDPQYEDFRTKLVFEQSNLDLDVVLRRTQRILLTVVDCATGEPIHCPKLKLLPWKHAPGQPQGSVFEPAETSGVLKDVEIFLRARDSTHAAVVVEHCLGNSLVLPVLPEERIGLEAVPVQFCVRRLKPVALRAKTPEGAAVGRFRIQLTVNRQSGPWDVSYDLDAGSVLDASLLQVTRSHLTQLQKHVPERPVESVELTRIECIAPDLRWGTLTDAEGSVLTLPAGSLGDSGTLANPISLLAGAWPAAEPVPLETLEFVIVPLGK